MAPPARLRVDRPPPRTGRPLPSELSDSFRRRFAPCLSTRTPPAHPAQPDTGGLFSVRCPVRIATPDTFRTTHDLYYRRAPEWLERWLAVFTWAISVSDKRIRKKLDNLPKLSNIKELEFSSARHSPIYCLTARGGLFVGRTGTYVVAASPSPPGS